MKCASCGEELELGTYNNEPAYLPCDCSLEDMGCCSDCERGDCSNCERGDCFNCERGDCDDCETVRELRGVNGDLSNLIRALEIRIATMECDRA